MHIFHHLLWPFSEHFFFKIILGLNYTWSIILEGSRTAQCYGVDVLYGSYDTIIMFSVLFSIFLS